MCVSLGMLCPLPNIKNHINKWIHMRIPTSQSKTVSSFFILIVKKSLLSLINKIMLTSQKLLLRQNKINMRRV